MSAHSGGGAKQAEYVPFAGAGPTVLSKFPVTSLMLLQYVALVLAPMVMNSSDHRPFMWKIVAIGVLGAFSGEFFVAAMHRPGGAVRASGTEWLTEGSARTILAIGLAALLVGTQLGIGTYAAQVGADQRSRFAPLITPLSLWTIVGLGLVLFCYAKGGSTRTSTLTTVGAAIGVYTIYVLEIGRIAPLAQYALTAMAGCTIVGLVRPRSLVIAMTVGALIWPLLYTQRNEVRAVTSSSTLYGQEITASDRLREDLLLLQAARVGRSIDVGQPSLLEVVRFGLIPRVVDPGRGELSTGRLLSGALGYSPRSAYTTTILGNIYLLGGGMVAVFVVPALLGVACSGLIRRLRAFSMVLVLGVIQTCLWIESLWPDGLGAPLQIFVSTLIAIAFLKVLRSTKRRTDALAPRVHAQLSFAQRVQSSTLASRNRS